MRCGLIAGEASQRRSVLWPPPVQLVLCRERPRELLLPRRPTINHLLAARRDTTRLVSDSPLLKIETGGAKGKKLAETFVILWIMSCRRPIETFPISAAAIETMALLLKRARAPMSAVLWKFIKKSHPLGACSDIKFFIARSPARIGLSPKCGLSGSHRWLTLSHPPAVSAADFLFLLRRTPFRSLPMNIF